jgi:hypothetical protein
MTAKLDKTIKRELELDGKIYTIAIGPDGIKITEKGRRQRVPRFVALDHGGEQALAEGLKASIDAGSSSRSSAASVVPFRLGGIVCRGERVRRRAAPPADQSRSSI